MDIYPGFQYNLAQNTLELLLWSFFWLWVHIYKWLSCPLSTLLKMTNHSWDPTSFYLGLIPYRIGTQHLNSRRDSSFLGKSCREQQYFFRTKMKIRKNCIVGIFSCDSSSMKDNVRRLVGPSVGHQRVVQLYISIFS